MKSSVGLLESFHSLHLPISCFQIIAAQKDDSSLTKCFSVVISSEAAKKRDTSYFIYDSLLIRGCVLRLKRIWIGMLYIKW